MCKTILGLFQGLGSRLRTSYEQKFYLKANSPLFVPHRKLEAIGEPNYLDSFKKHPYKIPY